MKWDRHEDLLCLRMWVLSTTPDKEVFGAPFYSPAPLTPARNAAHPVRPGRRPAFRRRADGRAGRGCFTPGTGHLARGDLYAAADALGVPQPGGQPRRLLPG